jgi:hypothetical protein
MLVLLVLPAFAGVGPRCHTPEHLLLRDVNAVAPPSPDPYRPEDVGYVDSTTYPLRIHYRRSEDADRAATVVLPVAETCWRIEIDQMGWPTPPADSGLGGDDKYDMYLTNEQTYGGAYTYGTGHDTNPDDNWYSLSSYIALDDRGIEIGVDVTQRLAAECKNVVGMKEASGNPDRVSQLIAACGDKFTVLSGDDSLTLAFMAVGAKGVISVASNVAPKQVSSMVAKFAAGDLKAALRLHTALYPLFKNLFVETNPAPAKAALALMGMMTEEIRLPLVPVTPKTRDLMKATIAELGLLK